MDQNLIILVTAVLNINSAILGKVKFNGNFFIACLLFLIVVVYFVWLLKIFWKVEEKRKQKKFVRQYSSMFEDLSEKGWKGFCFHFVTIFRYFSISGILVLLSTYDYFQLILLMYLSMYVVIATVMP